MHIFDAEASSPIHIGAAARAWVCGLLTAVVTAGGLQLGVFEPIHPGLDPSWIAALGEAAARGDIFGRDIIFTGGPLNALFTRYFDSVQWPYIILVGFLVCGTVAWSCGRLASNWAAALLLPLSIFAGLSIDVVFLVLPAFAALAVLIRPGALYSFIVLSALTAAAVMLAKFSPAAIAAVSFLAIDIALLRERRLPIAIASFVAAMVGWYAILESNIAFLFDFIRYSVETTAGYSAAMSLYVHPRELYCFLALAFAFGAIVVVRTCRRPAAASREEVLWAALVIAILGFTGFKLGFVRNDAHSMIGWGALAAASAAYTAFERQRLVRSIVIAISLLACAAVYVSLSVKHRVSEFATVRSNIEQLRSFTNLAGLAHDPHAWLREQHRRQQQGRAALRAQRPLPPIKGSVDALSSIQSAVIAAGLDYRPRFTIQDYTTYTRALIEKNRESWFGPRAPDHILFGLYTIDNRLPALSEGPLWPELLRNYEPTQRLPELALLSRRAHPLPDLLGAPIHRVAQLGRSFELAAGPTFLTIDIRYTWLGRLLSIVFKPPLVNLQLKYSDAREETYRIIPAIARARFVVSPQVKSADDFIALALGEPPAAGVQPTAAAVEVDWLGTFAYQKDADVTLRPIDLAIPRAARPTGMDLPPQH
jgi:hypothetical protein